MGLERRAELLNSMRTHFDAETERLDTLERLKWLFDHLDEYLDRWLSFCSREEMSMQMLVESDLHTVLLISVDMIKQETAYLADCVTYRKKWHDFVLRVCAIHGESEKCIANELRQAFMEARLALSLCCEEKRRKGDCGGMGPLGPG